MLKEYQNKKNTGFTIIEMMISVALFIIVITAGLTALLNANTIHNKSQNVRSALDNIDFIMDDISRSLRTGTNYHCYTTAFSPGGSIGTPQSCTLGGAIAFTDVAGDPNPVVYKIDASSGTLGISKSTQGGAAGTFVLLNTPDIVFSSWSGFSVLGAESAPDTQQPLVVIKLIGTINYQNILTSFSVQSSVSQRALDI